MRYPRFLGPTALFPVLPPLIDFVPLTSSTSEFPQEFPDMFMPFVGGHCTYMTHVQQMSNNRTWGTEVEIAALCKGLGRSIRVWRANPHVSCGYQPLLDDYHIWSKPCCGCLIQSTHSSPWCVGQYLLRGTNVLFAFAFRCVWRTACIANVLDILVQAMIYQVHVMSLQAVVKYYRNLNA